MSARVIAFIGCRLLALYVFLNYCLYYAYFLSVAIMRHAGSDVALYTVFLILDVAAVAFLWLRAGWISGQLARPLPETSNDGLNIDHWKMFCVAAIGAMFLFAAMKFIGIGLKAFISPTENSVSGQEIFPSLVINGLIHLTIGTSLIVWMRTIVRGLNAFGAWANKPFINEEGQ